jgi:hypothetical protein
MVQDGTCAALGTAVTCSRQMPRNLSLFLSCTQLLLGAFCPFCCPYPGESLGVHHLGCLLWHMGRPAAALSGHCHWSDCNGYQLRLAVHMQAAGAEHMLQVHLFASVKDSSCAVFSEGGLCGQGQPF